MRGSDEAPTKDEGNGIAYFYAPEFYPSTAAAP
jgi:hypothetical protein